MRPAILAVGLVAVAMLAAPACAGDDAGLARLALCKESWLDWQKSDPVQLKTFAAHFQADYSRAPDDAFFVPKSKTSVAGLAVDRVFPDSVGMGVGISVIVHARFADARRNVEKELGTPLRKCETGDNMRTCGLRIADTRTVMLMASDDAKDESTLVGCYYYYEK